MSFQIRVRLFARHRRHAAARRRARAGRRRRESGRARRAAKAGAAKADPRATIVKKIDGSSSKTCACRRSTASTKSRAARTSATCRPTAATPSSATCIDIDTDANLSENRRRGIRARMIETRSGNRDAGVLAEGSEVHDHGVHRHRLRLLPPAALADRRIQPARHPRALHVLPAHRARTPSRGTRPKPCGARRIATTRSRAPRTARTSSRRSAPPTSSSATTSSAQARRGRHAGHFPGERRDAAGLRAAGSSS